MIASIQDIIDHPEAHLNAETLRALATRVQQLTDLREGPKFVRTEHTEPARKSKHFMEAMMALTQRCAYSKSECALLIAEQALARENAELQFSILNQSVRLAPFTNLSVLQEPNKLHILVAGPTNTGKTLLLNKICHWLQTTYGVEARCNHLVQEPQQFHAEHATRYEQTLNNVLHKREIILSEIHLYQPSSVTPTVVPGWFETPLAAPDTPAEQAERDFFNTWTSGAGVIVGMDIGVDTGDVTVTVPAQPMPD